MNGQQNLQSYMPPGVPVKLGFNPTKSHDAYVRGKVLFLTSEKNKPQKDTSLKTAVNSGGFLTANPKKPGDWVYILGDYWNIMGTRADIYKSLYTYFFDYMRTHGVNLADPAATQAAIDSIIRTGTPDLPIYTGPIYTKQSGRSVGKPDWEMTKGAAVLARQGGVPAALGGVVIDRNNILQGQIGYDIVSSELQRGAGVAKTVRKAAVADPGFVQLSQVAFVNGLWNKAPANVQWVPRVHGADPTIPISQIMQGLPRIYTEKDPKTGKVPKTPGTSRPKGTTATVLDKYNDLLATGKLRDPSTGKFAKVIKVTDLLEKGPKAVAWREAPADYYFPPAGQQGMLPFIISISKNAITTVNGVQVNRTNELINNFGEALKQAGVDQNQIMPAVAQYRNLLLIQSGQGYNAQAQQYAQPQQYQQPAAFMPQTQAAPFVPQSAPFVPQTQAPFVPPSQPARPLNFGATVAEPSFPVAAQPIPPAGPFSNTMTATTPQPSQFSPGRTQLPPPASPVSIFRTGNTPPPQVAPIPTVSTSGAQLGQAPGVGTFSGGFQPTTEPFGFGGAGVI